MVSKGAQVGSGEPDALAGGVDEEQRDRQIMLTLVFGWALVVVSLWELL